MYNITLLKITKKCLAIDSVLQVSVLQVVFSYSMRDQLQTHFSFQSLRYLNQQGHWPYCKTLHQDRSGTSCDYSWIILSLQSQQQLQLALSNCQEFCRFTFNLCHVDSGRFICLMIMAINSSSLRIHFILCFYSLSLIGINITKSFLYRKPVFKQNSKIHISWY